MEEEEKGDYKQSKWLKNKYNLYLLGIIALAVIIRLYFFLITQDQTLWWDEAEYMATSKHWAFDTPYDLNPQRPPLFQLIGALFMILGFSEPTIKFFLVFLPSVFLVIAVYYLGKEMFGEKVALISALLAAVSWTFLFWSNRFQPDFFSISFQLLSIIFMWKFWKHESSGNKSLKKFIIFSAFFSALGLYFKVSALLVPMSFILFILIRDKFKAITKKSYWLFALVFLLTLTPYFIWAYITFDNPLAFTTDYSTGIESSLPFAWSTLSYFFLFTAPISNLSYLNIILFLLFLLGLVLGLKFLFYFDVILKNKEKALDSNMFSIILLLVVSAFYIFYIRGVEDRWVFLWLPFIFFFSSNALIFIKGKMNNKNIGAIVIVILLLLSVYAQVMHSNSLIKNKEPSYLPVKEAGLWLKENSDKDDLILSVSYTQTTYYSERDVDSFSIHLSGEEFNDYIKEKHPKYLQYSLFEMHPNWFNSWLQANIERLNPVYISYNDAKKTSANLVIYEILY